MFSRLNDRMKALKKSHGFSLVELLIVIVILAILAVAVFAGGSIAIKKAQVSQVTSDLHNFSVAIETMLNENPSVGTATDADYIAKLNKNLPADYELTEEASAGTGNITWTLDSGTTYVIAHSAKTDAWDNNYYVIFDISDRAAGSDYFVTVVSVGPDTKAALTGTVGTDDIFLLAQYTNGTVSAKTFNMENGDKMIKGSDGTDLALGTAKYVDTTNPTTVCPVIFK